MRACGSDADTEGRRCRALRTDAVRNRTRILDAAQEMFVEQGLQAPLDEIARRAGVGNATLYRHFSGREALLAEVLERAATAGADAAEEATAQENDPFAALSRFVQAAVRQRLASLCCLSGEPAGVRPELVRHKERLAHAAQLLLTHAQQAGRVRTDVSLEELMTAVTQLSRPLPGTSWSVTDQFSPRICSCISTAFSSETRSLTR
jgi:AcrR family transcriptional regulator